MDIRRKRKNTSKRRTFKDEQEDVEEKEELQGE